MSDDLVARLREEGKAWQGGLIHEAADEIERLREQSPDASERERIVETCVWCGTIIRHKCVKARRPTPVYSPEVERDLNENYHTMQRQPSPERERVPTLPEDWHLPTAEHRLMPIFMPGGPDSDKTTLVGYATPAIAERLHAALARVAELEAEIVRVDGINRNLRERIQRTDASAVDAAQAELERLRAGLREYVQLASVASRLIGKEK